jgi:preprotein translocase subunit SecE
MAMDTADPETEPRRKGGPFQFWREVRAEGRKVTWATRSEVIVSVVMVMIFTVVAAVFFFLVDTVASFVIRLILSIGH